MRPVHPNLRLALAAKDSPVRPLVEAQAEQRSDILRTKADLQSADTFTARTADFTSANALTAAAQTVEAALTNAPAANALYEAHFSVTITPVVPGAGSNSHTVVVAVETDPLGTGAWTEQWTFQYDLTRKTGEPATAVTWPSERLPVRVTGITNAGKLRLKIKTATGPGGWSFRVHGFNLATDGDLLSGVTYATGPAIDFLDSGGATLADTVLSKISLGTSDGYELDLNGPALSPEQAPFIVARTVWGKDDSNDIAIDRFTAQLHPKQNAANPKDVVWFICQPYALAGVLSAPPGNPPSITEYLASLVPLADPVRVPAGDGTTAQDYVFSFYDRTVQTPGGTILTLSRKPRPKSIQPTLLPGFQTLEHDHSPTTFWFIWATTADGTPATNVGWARDSGVTEVVNGSRKLRTVQVRTDGTNWAIEGPVAYGATPRPAFRCKIECGSYAAANLEYTTNLIDLGAAPTATVEFTGVAGVPDGCGSVFEVRNDADSAWLPFTDGQTAAEVGVSQRQTYKVRWRASPNATNDATPTLWEIGVRDVAKTWLSDLIVSVRGRWQIADVAELLPNIPEFEFVLIKNGEHDFADRVTALLSTNPLGSLAFRIWLGDPAAPRAEWLHQDDGALIDGYDPDAATVTVIAHSPLVFTNGALPVYNTTTQTRAPLQLANKTPRQVYTEIVNTQLAPDIPGRYRGEPLSDESCLISQTITDSDGLTQLNAIHHIAGQVLSTCAGKLKSFPMFGPGAVQALFPSEMIRWRSTSPNFQQRVPRFFVKYDYDSSAGSYRGEARVISGNDILATNLQPARIDARTEMRDEVSRWIPTELLATRLGRRRVDTLGAGMLVWPFTSVERLPWLEFGDVVAVQTDRFFARDPSQTAQRTLKGALWAIGRIVDRDVEGREFAVWIQGYTDIFGGGDVATRLGFALPTMNAVTLSVADSGVVSAVIAAVDAKSVKVATSTSAFPSAATVRAQSPQALDANGNLVLASLATLTDGQTLYVSVLAYEDLAAAGAESALASAQIAFRNVPAVSITDISAVWRAARLFVSVKGASGVLGFKVATSTASFPAAGTGTIVAGNDGLFDAGLFTFAQSAYVTVTPYPDATCVGVPGPARSIRFRLAYIDTMFQDAVGKPMRVAQYDDGSYALRATETDGSTKKSDAFNSQASLLPFTSPASFFSYAAGGPATGQMWISIGWTSQNVTRPDQSSLSIAAPPSAPAAPTLGQVAGGALGARTRFARVAYAKVDGGFTNLYPVSGENSFAISANNLLKITSPSDPGGGFYDGWVALVGSGSNGEFVQGVAHGEVISFGTDWTEPTTGFSTTQNSAWSASWKSLTRVALATAQAYYHYAYYDLTFLIVRLLSATARSAAHAAVQNGDGNVSLGSYDAAAGYSGAYLITTPGAGLSGSGNFGGGRLL